LQVRISYIEPRGSGNDHIAIYADRDHPGHDAEAQWETIKRAATTYRYAEQLPLPTQLRNWPNSWYKLPWQDPGNNSNTFAREMARAIGRDADVIGGNLAGAFWPGNIPDPGFVPEYLQ
jgi:hypothetical protein